ncbi:S1 RNA-binding domain-containing protein [Streptomyces sp. NPDC101213]|uniref:S1 RNA-binding domain-containing protein n=1 Tax=Streptomyces sp. NPDC101213 TaxID=3366130 RepID=UPI0037F22E48
MTGADDGDLGVLRPGDVHRGTVEAVTDFGVYVRFGGHRGLITVVNLTWDRFDHPSQVMEEGDEITVVVLSVDAERAEVSLSRKDLEPDPLVELARTRLGALVRGAVTRVTPIGAFVRVGPNAEGLLPVAGLRGAERERTLQAGDELEVLIEGINLRERQVALRLP